MCLINIKDDDDTKLQTSNVATSSDGKRTMNWAKWMDRTLIRSAPAELSVPRRLSLHTDPGTLFLGECFARACDYVEQHRVKGMHYVVGEALCGGIQQHGWIELPGDIVFDGVLQRFYARTTYYESEHAMPWYRFTRSAVIWLLDQRLPSWRWEWHLHLPWAKSASDKSVDALVIDKTNAQRYLNAVKRRTAGGPR